MGPFRNVAAHNLGNLAIAIALALQVSFSCLDALVHARAAPGKVIRGLETASFSATALTMNWFRVVPSSRATSSTAGLSEVGNRRV